MLVIVVLLLASSVATTTLVLSRSRLVKPLREWLSEHWPIMGELINCTFCTSIWVSIAHVAGMYPNRFIVVSQFAAVNRAMEVFALALIASPLTAMSYHAHKHMPPSKKEE